MTHTHQLIEARSSMKVRKEKERKKRNYHSWFISKCMDYKAYSFFSFTTRASVHNNNNILTFAILEYKSPF